MAKAPPDRSTCCKAPLDAPFIGADDDDFVPGELQALEVLVEDRRGEQVIDRHVEKALNLCRVQIHRQHAGRPPLS